MTVAGNKGAGAGITLCEVDVFKRQKAMNRAAQVQKMLLGNNKEQ